MVEYIGGYLCLNISWLIVVSLAVDMTVSEKERQRCIWVCDRTFMQSDTASDMSAD